MHFINSVNARFGVKVMVLLLIISFCIMVFYSYTSGAPEVTYGDVTEDGEIDVRDVVVVMQFILELRTLTDDQLRVADVNGDGEVDIRDATLIMRYALGLIDEFPTHLRVESVEEVELRVPYGTDYDDIDIPEIVKATLDDDSEKDIEVDWDKTSDPEYSPRSAKDYVFQGKLVNLPSGVGNPNDVKAKATVTVYLPWKTIPTPRPPVDPDPDPTEYTVTFEETNSLEGIEIKIYEDEGYEEQVSDSITTDQDGRASKDLEGGNYWFVAEVCDYQDFTGEFEVDDADLLIQFEMVPVDIISATIDPTEVDFDLYDPVDVESTITWNDASAVEAVYGEDINTDDWEVVSNTLSISSSFLQGFEDGVELEFEIVFDVGDAAVLKVNVIETPEYEITFEEKRNLHASIAVYRDEANDDYLIDVLDAESGTSSINLVDNSYSFKASPAEEVYDYEDYYGNFTVDGADKTIEFLLGPSEYEFNISPGEFVYEDELNNNDIDAAYYVYATDNNNPAEEVYSGEVDINFATVFEGTQGYEGVRFAFELIEVPNQGKAAFTANDYVFELEDKGDKGFWGPPDGFDIGSYYDVITEWDIEFKKTEEEAVYIILLSLFDVNNNDETVDNIKKKVIITVGHNPPNINNQLSTFIPMYLGY